MTTYVFFRNVICACELPKLPKKFQPKCIKAADVKRLYAELRSRMPELPANSKGFRGFNLMQLNKACQHLKVNGYIFDCEVTANGVEGHPGCLNWCSDFVEGSTRINMLCYEGHLMFIKDIKTFFKQWQCGKCRRCSNYVSHLDKHVKTCNGAKINISDLAVFMNQKNIKQSLAAFGIDVSKHIFVPLSRGFRYRGITS